jgi:hypothetical protein
VREKREDVGSIRICTAQVMPEPKQKISNIARGGGLGSSAPLLVTKKRPGIEPGLF